MTKIVSWNIQCGLGVDGQINLNRIAEVISSQGDPDIICLQEVARFDPASDQGQGADQYAILSDLFPHHSAFGDLQSIDYILVSIIGVNLAI